MAVPKKLFIPRKNVKEVKQPDYGTDMRAIEIFNPINQLVAGSGVSLSPTNGQGPQVTISASGGGAPNAMFGVRAGPDQNVVTSAQWFTQGPPDGISGVRDSIFPLWNTSSLLTLSYGISWLYPVFLGGPFVNGSVNIFPYINNGGPNGTAFFSSGGMNVGFSYGATSIDGTNQLLYIGDIAVTSGSPYQIQATDLTNVVTTGADLSLVAGSGLSGIGIVSASGTIPYFAGFAFELQMFSPQGLHN